MDYTERHHRKTLKRFFAAGKSRAVAIVAGLIGTLIEARTARRQGDFARAQRDPSLAGRTL